MLGENKILCIQEKTITISYAFFACFASLFFMLVVDFVLAMKCIEIYSPPMMQFFFNVISRSAVPCFVMLSGAFILSKNIDLQIFYRKSFFKLFLPTLIFSVLYVFYDALTQIIGLYFGFHVGGGR